MAESQSAKVIDNNDPEGLGRVRVQFYWAGWGAESDWMRMVQSYAGSGKGNYFRPEIGEEVHVSFEGGNAECPYVSGTYYNGKEKPDFFDSQNRIKGWKLPFGMLFKFIEKVGIILSDPSGNEIHLDEENKNINATSPETVTIRAKNIVFEASESITLKAGTNISEMATINKSTDIGGIMSTKVGGDKMLYVAGSFDEHIDGDLKSHTEKERQETGLDGIQYNTEKDIEKHAREDLRNNSGENTRSN